MKRFSLLHAWVIVTVVAFLVIAYTYTGYAAPVAPIIQSGTAVIDPGGTDTGLTYIHLDFPDTPTLVVSLQTQIPVDYVAGIAFSDSLGAITIDLQEPTTQLVYVNWVATMPTAVHTVNGEESQ